MAKFCQVVLVGKDGTFAGSCDSIFQTQNLRNLPVQSWFPFLESIFSMLYGLDKELVFAKVESPASFLPGCYDFTFSNVTIDEKDFLLWEVYDYTTLYEDFRQYQQKRNELEIQRQLLALQNKELSSLNEILTRGNITIQSIPNNASDYSGLITPLNALEIISLAMGSISDNTARNALESFLDSATMIRDIILELQDSLPEQESVTDERFHPHTLLEEVLLGLDNQVSGVFGDEELLGETLIGNVYKFKQIVKGLILLTDRFDQPPVNSLHFFIGESDKTGKLNLIIKITDIEGIKKDVNMNEVLLRLAIVKKMVEEQSGILSIPNTLSDGGSVECEIPYRVG